jgi:hypothetical protein
MFLFYINIYSQDTIYLNKNHKKIKQKELCQFIRVISQDPENNKLFIEQTFTKNGKIKFERIYSHY